MSFPEYMGGSNVNRAAKYILERFMQMNRACLSVYPQYVLTSAFISYSHFNCSLASNSIQTDALLSSVMQATDTANTRLVFAAIKATLFHNALRASFIL